MRGGSSGEGTEVQVENLLFITEVAPPTGTVTKDNHDDSQINDVLLISQQQLYQKLDFVRVFFLKTLKH